MFMHLKASFKQSHAAQCGNQKLPRIIILQKSELIYMVCMIYPPSSPKKKISEEAGSTTWKSLLMRL